MIMDGKKVLVLVVAVGLGGWLVGKYSSQPRERVVVKEVVKEIKTETKNDINTETKKYITACDPNSKTQLIEETKTIDKSVSDSHAQIKSKELVKETNKTQWLAGAGYGYNIKGEPFYSAEIATRVFNLPVFVGGQVITSGRETMGLIKLQVEF